MSEGCNRQEGCVCGGDTPAVRRGCVYYEDVIDYKSLYEGHVKIVNKIWETLGISDYAGANGKSIYEIIADLKEKAWMYDDLNK